MAAADLRLAAATVAAVVLSGASLAFAQGATVEIETELIIRQNTPTFHGKVKADNENCVEDRKVKLFKQKRSGGDKKLLGTDHASNGGQWKILFDKVGSGTYFAIAPKVEEGTAGTIYECLKAKSDDVPIQ